MDNQANQDEVKKSIAITALAENFGKEFSAELLGLWLDLLAPYPLGILQQAVKKVILEYKFKTIPPFAVLKEAIDDLLGQSLKQLEVQAMAEWGIVNKEVREVGRNSTHKFNSTTDYVLRLMGGWDEVCLWQNKDLDFKRKDFINFWVSTHGKVEFMQLGAKAFVERLVQGQVEKNNILTSNQFVNL